MDFIQEAQAVGLCNVVIGGLSQGCAMSLHISLNYEPAFWKGRPIEHRVKEERRRWVNILV
jgi:hypothetical protein